MVGLVRSEVRVLRLHLERLKLLIETENEGSLPLEGPRETGTALAHTTHIQSYQEVTAVSVV